MQTMGVYEFRDFSGIHAPGIYRAIKEGKIDSKPVPFPRGKFKHNGQTCRIEVVLSEKTLDWTPKQQNTGENFHKVMPNGVEYFGTMGAFCWDFNSSHGSMRAINSTRKGYYKKGKYYYF